MATDLHDVGPVTRGRSGLAVEDEFLDLVLADDDLLRAEFDAIITAAGLDGADPPRRRPPVREGRPTGDDRAGWPHDADGDHRDEDDRLRLRSWRDHVGVWAVGRQRSPPHLRRV